MYRFNQLDLEDLEFRGSLSLIMSWMIKTNNKRKDSHQPIASKQLIEIGETWAKWLFYEVVQQGNLHICFQALDQRYA